MIAQIIISSLLLGAVVQLGAVEPLLAWDFKGAEAKLWVAQAHQCKAVGIEDGVLKGVTVGLDPFITSPSFSLKATAGQVVEFRAKCQTGGRGELFWMPAGAARGQQKWSVSFEWIGDGRWHDYRVRPFWQGEKQITSFRLDFVNGRSDEMAFELTALRIVDESGSVYTGDPLWAGAALSAWTPVDGAKTKLNDGVLSFRPSKKDSGALVSPALAIDTGVSSVVAVEMAVSEGDTCTLEWACDSVSGLYHKQFKVKADGRFHTCNIEICDEKKWQGRVVLLRLVPVAARGVSVQLRSIRVCDDLQGPADITVGRARMANAINRAGIAVPLLIQFNNIGGQDSKNVRLAVKSLPKGVRVLSPLGWEQVSEIPASGKGTHMLKLYAGKALSGTAVFTLSGDGTGGQVVRVPLEILPDLKLPKSEYVPEPKPLKSDYDIGALYFPGWSKVEAWARIWAVAPERKPVLGWYDEANPEVVDWQIKWAVENGLSYFLVDWYWHKGHQHHDHWIKAFKQARYKSYLKWAVMWANHNAKGGHSEADQGEVAKFWIENYFCMPEYYRIEDKPVVMIWSPKNMNRDMDSDDGCKRLLDLSRKMAVEAGYKGIYFIAMKWPEASSDLSAVQPLKEMGFDMTSIYHFMDHGGKAQNPRRYPFELVADANIKHWQGRHETGTLPFLPNLSTGWDSRPWHGDKGIEIYGRTVKHFQKICRDAKRFADESGVKRLMLAPLNEWGEGSYVEPSAEYGFGMYETIRETFCRKPVGGWPRNIAPSDVGLGPYDLPVPPPDTSTEWSFRTGMQGWTAAMGIIDCKSGDAGLTFTTSSHDPAMSRTFPAIRAGKISQVIVRMQLSAAAAAVGDSQLFWSSGATPTETMSLSLPLVADGKFHDYVFEVGKSRAWRGRISYLRFDPCNAAALSVAVDSIRLVFVEDE